MPISSTPASMIDRVVAILDVFDRPQGLTLAHVVSRTGLPRSSVHRILEHLVNVQWLQRDGLHYHLGLRLLELGARAGYHNHVRTAASVYLHKLSQATGLTVHLTVLDGPEIIYLDKVLGRSPFRVPSRIGGRAPATCTGSGKALLAYADEITLQSVLRDPLPLRTAASIDSERRFRSEASCIKDRGVAFDREESGHGVGCVAAPIGPPNAAVAAVSVCGPVDRLNFDRLVAPLRATSTAIWKSVKAGRTANFVGSSDLHWDSEDLTRSAG